MFEGPVQDLIDELGKLPGIGPKSAQRIAFHLLSVEPPEIDRLTAVLAKVRDGVRFCAVCGNVSDDERCRICADSRRDGSQVCVVEEPKDIQAVERTRCQQLILDEIGFEWHARSFGLAPETKAFEDFWNVEAPTNVDIFEHAAQLPNVLVGALDGYVFA